jgi:DsbC/DsbD-like thiol-disulfide interchange protein
MSRHFLRIVLGLAMVAGLVAQTGFAGGKLDPVKVEAAAGKSDSSTTQVVVVNLSIDKGWHIYANPVGLEDLEAAQTEVIIKVAGKTIKNAKVKYPTGTKHTEKGVGTYHIYEDKVAIQAEFPKTDAAVEVSVRYQACDASKCLPPKTVKLSVK